MEKEASVLKGLFNDLTRTLLSSAILLDDLHLQLQRGSEVYDAWWLANEQLNRAIEFFLELRSTCFWSLESIGLRDKGKGNGRYLGPQDQTVIKISEALNIIIDSCNKLLEKGKGRILQREVKRVLKIAEEASKYNKMAILYSLTNNVTDLFFPIPSGGRITTQDCKSNSQKIINSDPPSASQKEDNIN